MRTRACRHSAVTTALLAVAFMLPARPDGLGAQAATPSAIVARAGETVRVRTGDWIYTGTLTRVTPDTAVVTYSPDSAVVPRAGILRVDVQRGTKRSATRIVLATAAGILGGAIIGGFVGVWAECGSSCSDNGEWGGVGGALSGIALGSLVGGLTGGTIAAQHRVPRWLRADLPQYAP